MASEFIRIGNILYERSNFCCIARTFHAEYLRDLAAVRREADGYLRGPCGMGACSPENLARAINQLLYRFACQLPPPTSGSCCSGGYR